jgi:hypothetical protein
MSLDVVTVVVAYALLIAITISGNLLVVIAFWRESSLQVICNFWIFSLSFTDICLAITVLPLQVCIMIENAIAISRKVK